MATTDKLKLPFIEASQSQKHVPHNDALAMLDALVMLSVKGLFTNTPPGSPSGGDRYITGGTPTGAWATKTYKLAAWQDGAWRFYDPQIGWVLFVESDGMYYLDQTFTYQKIGGGGGVAQNLTRLGINATADATNPVSARINKALWTALTAGEGGNGDLLYTMNKETAADDVGLLFQQGFSTRALLGLLADNDLTIKVSPNGSTFYNAISVDRNTGKVSFPSDFAYPTNSTVIRERLTTDKTYYVNPYSGNDANDGSSSSPFLTLAAAYTKCKQLDANGYSVTIQLADGSYYINNFTFDTPIIGCPSFTIQGNIITPSNVYISNTGYDLFRLTNGVAVRFQGIKLDNGGSHIVVLNYSRALIDKVNFGTTARHHMEISGGIIEVLNTASYTISGNSLRHVSVSQGGAFVTTNATITLTGSPSVTDYFMYVSALGIVAQWNPTYSGAFGSGAKYLVTTNSVIAGFSSSLPGTAGTVIFGGQVS